MKGNFQNLLPRILVSEGGRVDNPKDPGGRTNKGITQRVYTAYLRSKGLAARDVYNIADSEVSDIYKRQYWDAINGDLLPAGVDYAMLDAAVMSGPSQAIKWMQRYLGVTVDGHLGVSSMNAVNLDIDNDRLAAGICANRLTFCQHLKTWSTFGKGWEKRIAQVLKIAQQQASGSVGDTTVFIEKSNGKALLQDAKAIPSTAIPASVASGGALATTTTQVINAIQPVQDYIPHLGQAITVITAVTALAAIGGGAWLAWNNKRANARKEALGLIAPPEQPAPPQEIEAPPLVEPTDEPKEGDLQAQVVTPVAPPPIPSPADANKPSAP